MGKRSKNQIRRERLKLRKTETPAETQTPEEPSAATSAVPEPEKPQKEPLTEPTTEPDSTSKQEENTEAASDKKEELRVLFSGLTNGSQPDDELLSQYQGIFQKFTEKPSSTTVVPHSPGPDTESETSESEDEPSSLSKRQRRKLHKIPIAQLKASTSKPQAVEWYDADAPDPFLAVCLKTALNHIDVPPHWQQKKDYLSSKRGVERPPFQLPRFIQNTGIAEMRGHDPESLKKSQRDRVQPKMGKLDIDYQKLHDAFFKHQTKPRMLAFGELYSEGREKADAYREKIAGMRPGKVSKALRAAVGMPENENIVPPWVTLMHELGKPPSYSNMIIPGLDVEYKNDGYRNKIADDVPPFKLSQSHWGELEDGEVTEESEEESEEEEEEPPAEPEVEAEAPDQEDQPEKIEITEYSKIKTSEPLVQKPSTGSLYTVLKETPLESSGNLVGGKQKYEIGSNAEEKPEEKSEGKPVKPAENPVEKSAEKPAEKPEEEFKF